MLKLRSPNPQKTILQGNHLQTYSARACKLTWGVGVPLLHLLLVVGHKQIWQDVYALAFILANDLHGFFFGSRPKRKLDLTQDNQNQI